MQLDSGGEATVGASWSQACLGPQLWLVVVLVTCPVMQHTLRGLQHQSEIGFLSLFEHYGSCRVSVTI